MKKIFIGIPSIREYQPFLNSMVSFVVDLHKKYSVRVFQVKNKKIDEARNIIVNEFLKSNCDYLLFLDDDHSGHTFNMFEDLMKADTYVCAVKCYWKDFPYLDSLLDYSGEELEMIKYKAKKVTAGFHSCDLVGFGMTLIKRETFDNLEKPYFICENNRKEDVYFCDNLIKQGIKPIGCFDYVLTHQGVDDTNKQSLFEEGMEKMIENIKRKYPMQDLNNMTVVV